MGVADRMWEPWRPGKEKGRAKFAPTFLICLNTPASTSVVRAETNFFVDPNMGLLCFIARAVRNYLSAGGV
tara:strand:+ start:2249 stop:2461 length:213 start_codon:yes stop_codon:yes gene_type:complete